MKSGIFLLTLVLFLVFAGCSSDNNSNTSGKPAGTTKITFETTNHDFGKIIQGERVTYTFKFKNEGNCDLLIENAKASCGCTAPKYPKQPIAPGQEGTIEVTFDSGGFKGNQHKTVTVTSNTDPKESFLEITATVDVPVN